MFLEAVPEQEYLRGQLLPVEAALQAAQAVEQQVAQEAAQLFVELLQPEAQALPVVPWQAALP